MLIQTPPPTTDYTPVYVMREPAGFIPAETPANRWERAGREWYDHDPQGFREVRNEQHHALQTHVQSVAEIDLLPAVQEMGDLVFTADALFALNAHIVRGKFLNPNRVGEEAYYNGTIEKYGNDKTIITSPHAFEGNGDCLYDPYRGIILSGYHNNPIAKNASEGRGSQLANAWLRQHLNVPVTNVENKKPFYHIDTAMACLNRGHIMICEEGISAQSLKHLAKTLFTPYGLNPDEYLIQVSAKDANQFACNVRNIGNTIIMPECSTQLQDTLKRKGYDVTTTPMTAFIAAGGAVHCTTNPINQRHVQGGYHADQNRHLMPAAPAVL